MIDRTKSISVKMCLNLLFWRKYGYTIDKIKHVCYNKGIG